MTVALRTPLPSPARPDLELDGYCILPDLLSRAKIGALSADLDDRFERTPFSDGDFYGRRTKRFGQLLNRSVHARDLVMHPTVIQLVGDILLPFAECLQLNLTQAIEIHPNERRQVPHRDQNMWGGPKGGMQYLVNVIWPLTDFTAANGATLIWPQSHHSNDPQPPAGIEPVVAELSAGSALMFLGSTLHAGGSNRTSLPRRAVIISYCLGWLKPYENQWLCYPPSVARKFDRGLSELIGYRLHRPNLGGYEGQSPAVLLRETVPSYLGAIDEIPPDAAARLRQYLDAQDRSA